MSYQNNWKQERRKQKLRKSIAGIGTGKRNAHACQISRIKRAYAEPFTEWREDNAETVESGNVGIAIGVWQYRQRADQTLHRISLCQGNQLQKNLRGNFRTRAASIINNRTRPCGGRKIFNEYLIEICLWLWYSVRSTNRHLRRINNAYFDSDTFYNMWDFASTKNKENAERTKTSNYYWCRCRCTYHFRSNINLLHTFRKNSFTVTLITSNLYNQLLLQSQRNSNTASERIESQGSFMENPVSKKHCLMYNENSERRRLFECNSAGTSTGFRTSEITPIYRWRFMTVCLADNYEDVETGTSDYLRTRKKWRPCAKLQKICGMKRHEKRH